MYVAVKGGEKAIVAAHALQEQKRRGEGRLPEISVDQISQHHRTGGVLCQPLWELT